MILVGVAEDFNVSRDKTEDFEVSPTFSDVSNRELLPDPFSDFSL